MTNSVLRVGPIRYAERMSFNALLDCSEIREHEPVWSLGEAK